MFDSVFNKPLVISQSLTPLALLTKAPVIKGGTRGGNWLLPRIKLSLSTPPLPRGVGGVRRIENINLRYEFNLLFCKLLVAVVRWEHQRELQI